MDDYNLSVDYYKSRIELFKDIQTNKADSKALNQELKQLFEASFPQMFILKNMKGLELWRLIESRQNINEELISEFSYPPVHLCKTQRANILNHPVFYCSPRPIAPFYEVLDENNYIDKIYYLSKWVIITDNDVRLTPFVFNDNLPANCNSNEYNISYENFLSNHEIDEKEKKEIFNLLEYLSSTFLDEKHKISSIIAFEHMYPPHNHHTQIFIYPSIKSNKQIVNYAIHPNFVLENMKLEKILKLKVTELNKIENYVKFIPEKIAYNLNGFLYWIKRLDFNDEINNDLKKEFPEENF